jgi:hypothetical protein
MPAEPSRFGKYPTLLPRWREGGDWHKVFGLGGGKALHGHGIPSSGAGRPSGDPRRPIRCAITVDLHYDDDPRDIHSASVWLAEQGIAATFFVPSVMFEDSSMTAVLHELPALGHDVGSHAHEHDYVEVEALISGGANDLGFLSVSRDLFGAFYGVAPIAFRSPLWCYVGAPARRNLVRLGYEIDSSAAPQRFTFLSSLPFERGWSMSPRRPYYWPEGLLEIPTSSLVQPASTTTFASLRSGAGPFLRLLLFECQIFPDRVLALQFHARDFCPHSAGRRKHRVRPRLADCIPRRQGGLAIRHFLGELDPEKISAMTRELLATLQLVPVAFVTMSEAAASIHGSRPPEMLDAS